MIESMEDIKKVVFDTITNEIKELSDELEKVKKEMETVNNFDGFDEMDCYNQKLLDSLWAETGNRNFTPYMESLIKYRNLLELQNKHNYYKSEEANKKADEYLDSLVEKYGHDKGYFINCRKAFNGLTNGAKDRLNFCKRVKNKYWIQNREKELCKMPLVLNSCRFWFKNNKTKPYERKIFNLNYEIEEKENKLKNYNTYTDAELVEFTDIIPLKDLEKFIDNYTITFNDGSTLFVYNGRCHHYNVQLKMDDYALFIVHSISKFNFDGDDEWCDVEDAKNELEKFPLVKIKKVDKDYEDWGIFFEDGTGICQSTHWGNSFIERITERS